MNSKERSQQMKASQLIKVILILLMLGMLLAACGKTSQDKETDETNNLEAPDLLGNKSKDDNKKGFNKKNDKYEGIKDIGNDDEEIKDSENNGKNSKDTWSDRDGLVKVWKEGSDYFIYYDLDKWEALHDITSFNQAAFPNSTFVDKQVKITGINEGVKDIVILSIDGYGGPYGYREDFPNIFFIMESGYVAWKGCYPPRNMIGEDGKSYIEDEQYIYHYLPYIEDIISLSIENDNEGMGTETVFAIDKKGLRYDIRHVLDFDYLVFDQYACYPSQSYGGKYDIIDLHMGSDGAAYIFKTIGSDAIVLSGTYIFHLDDSSSKGFRAPSISFDMELEPEMLEAYPSEAKFQGTFLVAEDNNEFQFFHVAGDSFEEGQDHFTFTAGTSFEGGQVEDDVEDEIDIWYMSEEDFMNYVKEAIPEVVYKMENMGMALLVDGTDTDLADYGYCRNIYLGTNHGGQFVKENHYTVTTDGIIFAYNVLEDLWYITYYPEWYY